MTGEGHDPRGAVTRLLDRAREGDACARDELFDLVYADLRAIAQRLIGAGSGPPGAFQATELVNAACLHMLDQERLDAENRRHFFYLLKRAMHDVLVKEARSAAADKRGGGRQRVPLVEFAVDDTTTVCGMLELSAAIAELHEIDPDAASVVRLRYFCGRSLRETAELMDSSLAVVRRHWDYAQAWLRVRLAGDG